MIAFTIAAALLLDPSPKDVAAPKSPQPVAQTVSDSSTGTVLSAVAVTLDCTAHSDGRVSACKVLGETHPGLGFGEAAIALMRDVEVEPSPRDFQFAHTIQFTP